MAIPPIAPYPMPTEPPENSVRWTPDPRRTVLLIHDMQNYFLDAFPAGRSPTVELTANVLALREYCCSAGVPVVYSAQPGAQEPADRGLLSDFWGPGIGADPREAQIIEPLEPRPGDVRLTKWRYSAFQRTGLAEFLAGHGRDQLVICGVYAHIGVLMTACEAFMRDIETFVVADAVADFSAEHHAMALTYAASRCAVTMTTGRLVGELGPVSTRV